MKPWITGELHKLIKEKRRLFKKARRSRTEGVWNRYKLIRNKVRIAYKKAYSDYVTQLFKKKDNRKSFWSFVKNKRKSSDAADSFSVNGAKIQDPGKIANGFNGLFASFFTTPSDACCNTAPVLDFPQLTNLFVTRAQIASEINKLPPGKAHGPDGITTQINVEVSISCNHTCFD